MGGVLTGRVSLQVASSVCGHPAYKRINSVEKQLYILHQDRVHDQ